MPNESLSRFNEYYFRAKRFDTYWFHSRIFSRIYIMNRGSRSVLQLNMITDFCQCTRIQQLMHGFVLFNYFVGSICTYVLFMSLEKKILKKSFKMNEVFSIFEHTRNWNRCFLREKCIDSENLANSSDGNRLELTKCSVQKLSKHLMWSTLDFWTVDYYYYYLFVIWITCWRVYM